MLLMELVVGAIQIKEERTLGRTRVIEWYSHFDVAAMNF